MAELGKVRKSRVWLRARSWLQAVLQWCAQMQHEGMLAHVSRFSF